LGVCSPLPSLVDQNSYTSETSLVIDPTILLLTRGRCTRETIPVGFFTSFSTLTRQPTPLPFLPPPLTLVSGTGGAPLFATRHCIRSRRCNRARRRHEPTTSTFSPSSPSSSGLCLPESRHSALFHSTASKDPAWSCSAALNYHKLPPDARRWSTVTDTGLCRWFCPSLCPVIYSHSLNPKCSHA
jgi:hypothetical protein